MIVIRYFRHSTKKASVCTTDWTPPEIDMLNEQNETTEQESNLFTVMDEHIPSPPEIEAEDILVLPEIQSMTDYIRLHFEEKLVEELSRSLR